MPSSQTPTHPMLIDLLIINPLMTYPPLTRSYSVPQHLTSERVTNPNIAHPNLSSHDSSQRRILRRIRPLSINLLKTERQAFSQARTQLQRTAPTPAVRCSPRAIQFLRLESIPIIKPPSTATGPCRPASRALGIAE